MMEFLDFQQATLLIIIGLMAGAINTFAGGGSNLSLPALMMLGLPADVANATNRLSVLLQSLTATRGFYIHQKIDNAAVKNTFTPLFLGGLAGAFTASYMDVTLLKPVLLGTMICVSIWVVVRSDISSESKLVPINAMTNKYGFISTLAAGFYGGFIQAGVGFVLIAVFVGVLSYDLLRANALKVVATVIFTSIALLVFIFRGQVAWLPGFFLALGSMLGAQAAVNFAVEIKAKTLKVLVLAMTIFASAAAYIF